jgi:hypothetical protein
MSAHSSKFETLSKKLKALIKGWDFGEEDGRAKDVARIDSASRLLQISEFRFFKLAYLQWYGTDIPDSSMENIFADYMFINEVPHWARHLARKVLTLYFQSDLDPRVFNIDSPPPPQYKKKNNVFNPIWIAAVYVVFYIIITCL